MRLPDFDFHEPGSLDELLALLERLGDSALMMAGGTDVLPALKQGRRTCDHLIWLKRLPELETLRFDEGSGLTIGAMSRLEAVRALPATRERYPALAESIRNLATPQTRAKGTVAGNICNASPCADTATPLLAYGARARIAGRGGRRELPLEEFFRGPGQTALERGEVITEIVVPVPPADQRTVFRKFSPRSKVDIAAVNVTVGLRMDGATVAGARVFLGTVAPTPVRAPRTEALLEGAKVEPLLLDRVARTAREECAPITDHRATKEYKLHMVGVLVRRAVEEAAVLS